MKRNIVIAYMLTTLLAGCVEDTFLGDLIDGGDHALLFGPRTEAMSRSDKTGAEAAADLGNSFVVYGAKYMGGGDAGKVVLDHYNVAYQGAPNSTTSNYAGWEYVGVPTVNMTNTTIITGFNPVKEQPIKYWDKNFDYYDFVAFSRGKGTASFTPVDMTKAGKEVKDKTPVYSITGKMQQLASAYIADIVNVQQEDYRRDEPVTPRFRSLSAKVRIAMYEVIPGYSVKDVKFYKSDGNASDVPCIYANDALIPVDGGTINVYYPFYNSTTEPDRRNEAVSEVTSESKTKDVAFSSLVYGAREGLEALGNYYLGRSLPTATYTTSDHSYINVLPQTASTTLSMKCDYTLVPIDDATEKIEIKGATTTIPAIYSYWMPNYAYTYVFKITDDKLKPITFDAVMVNNGYQETVTELAMPAITTYQKGNAYTTNNPPAYGVYDPAQKIYMTVVTSSDGLVTLTADNSWLYKVDREKTKKYDVNEGTVDKAAIAENHTYSNIAGDTVLVLTPVTNANTEAFTYEGTVIPGNDSPTGVDMTVDNASFTPQTENTYVFQYKMSDAQYGAAPANTLTEGETYYKVTHVPSDGTKDEYWNIDGPETAEGGEVIDGTLYKSKPEINTPAVANTLKKGETYYTLTSGEYKAFTAKGDEVVGGDVKYYTRSGDEGSYTYTEVKLSDCNTLTAGSTYYYTGTDNNIYCKMAKGDENVKDYYTVMTEDKWDLSEANTLAKGQTYYTRSGTEEPYTYTQYTAVGDEEIKLTDGVPNYFSLIMPVQYIYKVIEVK